MGYYGVFVGLHYQNDRAMSKALESDVYLPAQTITLKVPVSIPYMPDQTGFERVDGKFEHNGELYRLVKQRYAKDTLTIVCVRDAEHKKIKLALAAYVKTFSDKASSNKPSARKIINFIKDYLPISISIHCATEGWALRMTDSPQCKELITGFSTSITHPPEII
jgi:hypothetical protein